MCAGTLVGLTMPTSVPTLLRLASDAATYEPDVQSVEVSTVAAVWPVGQSV